ncbi:cytochrome c [uncultured Massilia sp.]|uniref:c-type cytochrome n=1 Tax=uncultured Massilia sp. TaxID=169973 RepID=UPI0025DCCE30|nr:cytochrome c [uncultured Massilia sp.]
MRLRITAAAVAALAVAAAGLALWTRAEPIAPVDPPAAAAAPAVLAAGARVVALGDCMVCHTARGGAAYAGGLGLDTPFGTIYSTNITPDPETGIGRWSAQAFRRALREGVSRDGHLLYPAFPYIHTTRMSDADIEASYHYLMSREPVRATPPDNALVLPLNFRPLLAFWNMLYLRPGDAGIPARQATPLERGRYLVDTLGHCASCHSGMNLLGGERHPPFQGGNIDGWDAPALTRLTGGAAPWTQAELVDYLRGGLSGAHGAAKGPMRPVTERLAGVPREDVDAMAAYLMSIQDAGPAAAPAAAPTPPSADLSADLPGRRLFAAACAGCHAPAAPMMRVDGRPGLARSSAVLGERPDNFVQTVLHGIPWETGSKVYMPPFADTLSDAQVAELAAYVRTGLAGRAAWPDTATKSATLRKETPQ